MIDFLKKVFKSNDSTATKYYLSICCIIKDENQYLNEWMHYHLKAGVEHFFIYDNGSKTPIKDTIKELGLEAYATVETITGKAKQVKAYAKCLKKYGSLSNWIAFIDTDEFIVAKSTKGQLKSFLADYEEYGGLAVNWQVFGSSGHKNKTNRPQLESFVLRAKDDFHVNKHIKSFVQPRFVKSTYNAHSFIYIKGKFCVNENFDQIEGSFAPVSVTKIQLNHYFCRSREEFDEKMQRGNADTKRGRTLDQFGHHDDAANEVEDKEILTLF